MKKVLILGKDGMLGTTVFKFFKYIPDMSITGLSFRLTKNPIEYKDVFEKYLVSHDFVINCIGAIPQKTSDYSINYSLPEALISFCSESGTKMIQPSTDCEFDGNLSAGKLYSVTDNPDSTTEYGLSKILGSNIVLKSGLGKVIRTSIIGLSPVGGKGVLDWFLKQEGTNVFGYEDHYWNGVTTLEWAMAAHHLINNYDTSPNLIQLGSTPITKADLLRIFRKVFNKRNPISPVEVGWSNKCLKPNFDYPNKETLIEDQLANLKAFNLCM